MDHSTRTSCEQVARIAISKFLSHAAVNIRAQANPHATAVEDSVRTITSAWDVGDVDPLHYKAAVNAAVCFSVVVMASAPLSVQRYVALSTTLFLCIDDSACPKNTLTEFTSRFCAGLPQLHSLLDRLAEVLKDTESHFPLIVANKINRSVMDFVDATVLDSDMGQVPLHPGALNYILEKRKKNGLSIGYGLYTWDKARFPDPTKYMQALPDFEVYINYANDVLSFYKEELVGEQANFVHERASITKRSVADALYDTTSDTISAAVAAREILEGTPEGDACEAVMGGYARWHFVEARYRLEEIIGDDIRELL